MAAKKIYMPLKRITPEDGFYKWWVVKGASLVRWKISGDNLIAIEKFPDGTKKEYNDNDQWQQAPDGNHTSGASIPRTMP